MKARGGLLLVHTNCDTSCLHPMIGGDMDDDHRPARRVRIEQGIYLQPNGKYAVCFMAGGRPRFRTVGYDIGEARAERAFFIESTRAGMPLATPELRFARVA